MKRVSSLDVACQTCGAVPGRTCRRADGVVTSPHDVRRRRARDEQARLNPEHSAGQLPLFPAKDARGPVVFVCRRGRR